MQQLIFDTFDDPKFVHELMKITTETAKVWGNAILSTGASLGYTEAAASCDVISPSLYKEFIKPYHIGLFSYFKEKRSSITLHICGNALPILRDMVETGPLVISLDSKVALSDAIQIIGQDTVILGNVSTDLFIRGTRKDMDDAVKECIEAAHKKSRFILCSGCEVPINAPFDNLRWFMESARKYGTA
jgi:uroporphyrinogen decarboxylase